MFSLNSHQTYHLYRLSTDMRKGFKGRNGLVRNELKQDPLDGSAYIFLNCRRDRMKVLVWESGGFTLYYKLLESGTFQLPQVSENKDSCSISWHQLMLIMQGVELHSIKQRKRFNS